MFVFQLNKPKHDKVALLSSLILFQVVASADNFLFYNKLTISLTRLFIWKYWKKVIHNLNICIWSLLIFWWIVSFHEYVTWICVCLIRITVLLSCHLVFVNKNRFFPICIFKWLMALCHVYYLTSLLLVNI